MAFLLFFLFKNSLASTSLPATSSRLLLHLSFADAFGSLALFPGEKKDQVLSLVWTRKISFTILKAWAIDRALKNR
jgi:hypothetical protein